MVVMNSEATRQQENLKKSEQGMKHIPNQIDRFDDNLEELEEKLENGGKEVKALADRLIQLKEEEELAKQTMDQIGGIHILLDMLKGGLSGRINLFFQFVKIIFSLFNNRHYGVRLIWFDFQTGGFHFRLEIPCLVHRSHRSPTA